MSNNSTIEWTDSTWNPVTGCTKISPGCKNCYAETFAERWRGIPGHPYEQGFDLRLWPERLSLPLTWKVPRMIFVNSMSDLFHKDVPDDFIQRVFATMVEAKQHTFQLLTKRSERLMAWTNDNYIAFPRKKVGKSRLPRNVWLGVSVESQDHVYRIRHLQATPAQIRFLSIEPLLGPVKLSASHLQKIHWVIVGGESGPGARPMNPDWARAIKRACKENNIPFFFKQWGAYTARGERVGKKRAGRVLDGKTWNEMPEIIIA